MNLHLQSPNLPGDISAPRAIEVINEKLDLIERLSHFSISFINDETNQKGKDMVQEMIQIELEAIKRLIDLDKKPS